MSLLRPVLRGLYHHWYARRGQAARTRCRGALDALRPVHRVEPYEAEMHILCGGAQAEMGLWSAWSLLRSAPEVKLYVHSDGSLDDGLPAQWQRLLPDTVLVSRSSADELFSETIGSRFPRLGEWRRSFLLAARLIDMHLFGECPTVMHMDTDVLFFTRPEELLRHACGKDLGMAWCIDVSENYYPPRQLAKAVFGDLELPPRLNAGVMAVPRLNEEWFERIDSYIAQGTAVRFPSYPWHAEQTIFAALAAQIGGKALPPAYGVASKLPERELVCQHYVPFSVFRHRFFSAGLPTLLKNERRQSAS
jgi:hypothetical protein